MNDLSKNLDFILLLKASRVDMKKGEFVEAKPVAKSRPAVASSASVSVSGETKKTAAWQGVSRPA